MDGGGGNLNLPVPAFVCITSVPDRARNTIVTHLHEIIFFNYFGKGGRILFQQ